MAITAHEAAIEAEALRPDGLSKREYQVLNGISYGLSNGAIGRKLFVSEDTVKTHARRLYRKLGVRDRSHAVRVGLERGILTANAPLRPAEPNVSPNPQAVPGQPVPTDWLPVPKTQRPYSDGVHIPACILAQACPCRRQNGQVSA